MVRKGVIERYREYLDVSDDTPIVSLKEGSTPLILAERMGAAIHPKIALWLKL